MKKTCAVILALIMCLGTVSGVFAAGKEFTDVSKSDWFYNDVQSAVELGLVNGKTATTYAPKANLTYAEAIKLAACMHQLYTKGTIDIGTGNPWYAPYVEYCKKNNIISKDYNYTEKATRAGYMGIFANALPGDGLEAINSVADDSIPDVPSSKDYAAGVYKLYRAGILQGVDAAHNCKPLNSITRSEVAAILTRMMNKSKRIEFTLGEVKEEPKKEEPKKEEIKEEKEEVVEPVKFTKDPIGGAVDVGTTIVTNITVTGGVAPYTYQWEYNDGNGWKNVTSALGKVSGETTVKISIKAESAASYKVRCVAKDSKGNEAISKETEFTFKEKDVLRFTKQPESLTGPADKPLYASVEVAGGTPPYTYQWAMDVDTKLYSLIGSLGSSGADTEKITFVTTKPNDMDILCIVKDSKGTQITSKTVKIVFTEPEKKEEPKVEEIPAEPLKITKQPSPANVNLNETAVFEVEVTGGTAPYTYMWLYENCEAFYPLVEGTGIVGTKTAKLSITSNNPSITNFLCQITDAAGKKITSKKVEFQVGPKVLPLAIESAPESMTLTDGKDAVLTVKAKDGIGSYTYQWQMNIGTAWVPISDNTAMSGTKTDTLTLKYTAGTYIDVRCVVKDTTNATVNTDKIRVTFE